MTLKELGYEYLRQYEYAVNRAARCREEYENESMLIDAVRSLSDNDGMPHGSGISKPTENKAIKLADKRQRLIRAENDAIEIRDELFDFINSIDLGYDIVHECIDISGVSVILIPADNISGVLTKRHSIVPDCKADAVTGKAFKTGDAKRVSFGNSDTEFVLEKSLFLCNQPRFNNRVKLSVVCGDEDVTVSTFQYLGL